MHIIGNNPAIQAIIRKVKRLAFSDSSILITGESGTGKSALARMIHEQSNRHGHPYFHIDCASIPLALLESEFFGYEKGSFTGAYKLKRGKFEDVGGGTIYLDQIAALDHRFQAKLIGVFKNRYFERIGGDHHISFDARVITSCSMHPSQIIKTGIIRKDLFYQLNVISLHLPPLRERQSDIPLLVEDILDRLSDEYGYSPVNIEAEAMDRLQNYQWPGNIRELENVLEHALLLSNKLNLSAADIILYSSSSPESIIETGIHRYLSLDEIDKLYIQAVLRETCGNKTRAAQILGINRKTLLEKRKRYGLD